MYFTTFYLLYHRFHISKTGSYDVRHQHAFQCHLIESILHIHQSAFATTALITLDIQPSVCHPRLVGQCIPILYSPTLFLIILLYQIRFRIFLPFLPAHHCQPTLIDHILVSPLNGDTRKIIGDSRGNQLRDKVHSMRRLHIYIFHYNVQIDMKSFSQLLQPHRLYPDSSVV